VVDYPQDFLADLRSPRSWPALEGSLWRTPYLARATFGHAAELVQRFLPSQPAKVLEVGAGTGYLSLEMARSGHEVVALDTDAQAVAIATATLRTDQRASGAVTFHHRDIATWAAAEGAFDVVVVSRVLHHLDDVSERMAELRRWLRPDGRLICLDFAYDRFDRRSARWLALVRSVLQAVDAHGARDLLAVEPSAATDRVLRDWWRDHSEHELRTWVDMSEALDTHFVQQHLSWHPYLYWEVLADLRGPTAAAEEHVAATVMRWERLWLAEGEMPAVLFLFAGEPRT
jgi:SAM-dependent methyltransferase